MAKKVVALRGPGRPAFDPTNSPVAGRFNRACQGIRLIKNHATPLWRQLAEQLEAVIRSGDIEPHSRIPSEESLSELFGVSRPVVRHAMQTLAGRGLIVKVHRKGIFVGSPPLETDFITTTLSVYDDMVARGHQVRTNTLEFYRCAPDEQEREALKLNPDETVVRIVRVFWMDDEPITFTRMSLHGERVPGFELIDVEDRSILGLVRERYGLRLKRAERWFKAAIPPANVTHLMGLPDGTPMIEIESIAVDDENRPLEYYRAFYHSETARIHLSVNA